MLKTTTAIALMGSASATVAPMAKQRTIDKPSFKGLHKIMASKPAATAEHLGSTAAVAGTWITFAGDNNCPATIPAEVAGFKMGYCAANNNEDTTNVVTYAIYSCTEDVDTTTVVLSSTTYTDAACTAGASVQTPVSLSTGCDADGFTVSCPTASTYDAAYSEYSNGGLMVSAYDTSSTCNSGASSDVIMYEGFKGCLDGDKYEEDEVSFYITRACTGDAFAELDYADVFPVNCGTGDDDDDYDDDDYDDDDIITYDNLYFDVAFNVDDGDDDCFHVESTIDYKGVKYTYDELKAGKEPECTVPHSPASKGVVISTSCDKTVRVTDTHLMATTKGFQLAYSLKAGDVLFGDYEKEMCTVKSVEKEKTTQQYFGLNCVHSEVLASGLRASTFGDFHTLPSWYMTYVGGLVGQDTASSLGEYIAEWYFQK